MNLIHFFDKNKKFFFFNLFAFDPKSHSHTNRNEMKFSGIGTEIQYFFETLFHSTIKICFRHFLFQMKVYLKKKRNVCRIHCIVRLQIGHTGIKMRQCSSSGAHNRARDSEIKWLLANNLCPVRFKTVKRIKRPSLLIHVFHLVVVAVFFVQQKSKARKIEFGTNRHTKMSISIACGAAVLCM